MLDLYEVRVTNKYVWFTSRIPPERRGDPNGVQHCLAVWWPRSDTCGCYVGILVCGYIGMWVCCYVGILVCGYIGMLICRYNDKHDDTKYTTYPPISHKKFLPSLACLPKSPYL